jgi:hypothetical protein
MTIVLHTNEIQCMSIEEEEEEEEKEKTRRLCDGRSSALLNVELTKQVRG